MNITEIKNYLTKKERTVTGVKFEQGTDPLLNTDLVDVPESDNWLNLTVTFFDLETDQIYRLRESHIKPYARRKKGSKPANSMSDAQRNAIRAIEYNLNVKFNGRSLDDVSMFIGLFKAESVKRYRQNKDFERMLFEGQTSHDLFHS